MRRGITPNRPVSGPPGQSRLRQGAALDTFHAMIARRLLLPWLPFVLLGSSGLAAEPRPNILFCIADDWGWPHAGAYGEPVVATPVFDRLAREGVLFHHAFVSAPSCTSSRAAILTGQYHWRLKESANLWSTLRASFPVYPELLEAAGYFVGHTGKGWGPGRLEPGGRKTPPAGKIFKSFEAFLAARPKDQPFCFWFGSFDPHRPYDPGSGQRGGLDLSRIRVPACFPDAPVVRSDMADYFWEVQRYDRQVAELLKALERIDELGRTIVVMTGDNGMPFPRCKANLYDLGTRVPLAIRWPHHVRPGRNVDDLVSLTDLAPTFLEAAGLTPPPDMTGRSLVPILSRPESGRIDPARDTVLVGKERHCPCQEAPDPGGYPCRALRTHEYLYVRNYTPDRWPAGTPHFEKAFAKRAWYADTDNGPTKSYIIEGRERDGAHRRWYELSFAKRPSEELYDLSRDADQLNNVAGDVNYEKPLHELRQRLTAELRASRDPREVGGAEEFEACPYYGSAPQFPGGQAK